MHEVVLPWFWVFVQCCGKHWLVPVWGACCTTHLCVVQQARKLVAAKRLAYFRRGAQRDGEVVEEHPLVSTGVMAVWRMKLLSARSSACGYVDNHLEQSKV